MLKFSLSKRLDQLTSSYWFIPSIMCVIAALLAVELYHLDQSMSERPWSWLFINSADGARAVLSTIASSVITVAGVSFSVTIVAFSLASQQFGPRLVTNIMRDKANQFVLGAFTSTFIYCLLVLRTVHGEDDSLFVPHLSILGAVFFTIVDVGVFIFFIHHLADAVRLPTLVHTVTVQLDDALGRYRGAGRDMQEGELKILSQVEPQILPSSIDGYIISVDSEELVKVAQKYDCLVKLIAPPGEFVFYGEPLAEVFSYSGSLNKVALGEIAGKLSIGKDRTPFQDPRYSLEQLVQIALSALSPSSYDIYTAIHCVDPIAAALRNILESERSSSYVLPKEAGTKVRVIVPSIHFSELLYASLGVILQYSKDHQIVMTRVLKALSRLAESAPKAEQKAAILELCQIDKCKTTQQSNQLQIICREIVNKLR